MSNVIDMFSRKPMGVSEQDTEANDQQAVESGTYIGHVDQETAIMVKQSGMAVEDRATQIDAIVAQWQVMALKYHELVDNMLAMLDVEGFDPSVHAIQISEEGHVWIIERRDLPTSEAPEA